MPGKRSQEDDHLHKTPHLQYLGGPCAVDSLLSNTCDFGKLNVCMDRRQVAAARTLRPASARIASC